MEWKITIPLFWKKEPLRLLYVILFLAAALFLAMTQIRDNDVWWHIASGRYVFQEGSFPATDIFSYTASDYPLNNMEWLFGIVLYPFMATFGTGGLVFVKALVCMLTFGLFLVLLSRRCGNRYITLGFAFWVLIIARDYWMLRPELFAYPFIALLLLWLHTYSSSRSRSLYFAPGLILVWACLDRTASVGLLLIGLYILGDIIKRIWRLFGSGTAWSLMARNRLLMLILLLLLCCLVQMTLAPGVDFSFLFQQPVQAAGTAEVNSPSPLEFPTYGIMLLAAVIALFMNLSSMDPTDSLVLLVFGLLSLKTSRNIMLFAFCSAPVLSRQAADLAEKLPAAFLELLQKAQKWINVAICIVLALTIAWAVRRPAFGLSAAPMLFPKGGVEYVKQENPERRMFNYLDWGGYAIWNLYPSYRVFIDGRGSDTYPPDIRDEYTEITGGQERWEELCDRYGINFFFIPANQELLGLIEKLWESPRWRLVYWDLQSLIYVRDIPPNQALIDSFQYKNFNTEKEEPTYWIEPLRIQITSEIKHFLKEFPDQIKPRNFLAMKYLNEGRLREAAEEYTTILSIKPKTPTIHHNLALIASSFGEGKKAEEEYLEEIKINPSFPPSLNNLAQLYLQHKQFERAEELFQKALKIDPHYIRARNNLAVVYMQKGQYEKATAELENVLKDNPNDRAAFYNLRYIQSLKNQQAAERAAREKVYGPLTKEEAARAGMLPPQGAGQP